MGWVKSNPISNRFESELVVKVSFFFLLRGFMIKICKATFLNKEPYQMRPSL